MSTLPPPLQQQPHPAPHRNRVGRAVPWFALLGAPLAWSLQLLVNAPLAAHACYPQDRPLPLPATDALGAIMLGVEGLALLLCVLAGACAVVHWRRTRAERGGSAQQLVQGGDGRSRFMSLVGVFSSALFGAAVLLTATNVFIVAPCGG